MTEKYWFKARKGGYGWTPSTWQGWAAIFLYIVATIHSFIQIDGFSHSASDTLMNFLPRVFIFSALLTITTYLKGEPVTWHFGDKRKPKAP